MTYFSLPLRAVFIVLTCSLLSSLPWHVARAASPLLPELARWSEVRKDELTHSIAPADLQIALAMPFAACNKPGQDDFNIVLRWHCAGMMQLQSHPEMADFNMSVIPSDSFTDTVSATIGQFETLGLVGERRYIAIVDWQIALRQAGGSYYNMGLATETVLFDTKERRWLWQAVHRYETYTGKQMPPEAVVRDLVLHLKSSVLPPMLNRPNSLAPSDRYSMNWVPPAQALQPPPSDRARVVLFNDYFNAGRSYEAYAQSFELMADADVIDGKSRYTAAAVKLNIGSKSYVAFDLTPGDYSLFLGVDQRKSLKLKAGEVQFIRHSRGLLNRLVLGELDMADAEKLREKSKHAILEDRSEPPRAHTPVRFTKD
jgi:hypothetical protein